MADPPLRTSPIWVWGKGALESSLEELSRLPCPYLLIGEARLLSPWRKRILGAWTEAGLEILPLSFPEGSECCEEQAKAIAAAAKSKNAGTLIAWGGGKCIDAVKWAGLLCGLPVAAVPTSAATCACATSVVVAHSPAGEVLDIVDLKAPPDLCIADFGLLESAPLRTLKAGMADTAAKWLEWQAVEIPEGPGAEEAKAGYAIAMDPGSSNERLWEANLKLSSRASNLGGAPAAAAHSFCAGISLLPASREWLHGEWAGLGLLFQEQLSPGPGIKAWLLRQGLPARLPFDVPDLAAVAARIAREDESIWLMKSAQALSLQKISDALSALSE